MAETLIEDFMETQGDSINGPEDMLTEAEVLAGYCPDDLCYDHEMNSCADRVRDSEKCAACWGRPCGGGESDEPYKCPECSGVNDADLWEANTETDKGVTPMPIDEMAGTPGEQYVCPDCGETVNSEDIDLM